MTLLNEHKSTLHTVFNITMMLQVFTLSALVNMSQREVLRNIFFVNTCLEIC